MREHKVSENENPYLRTINEAFDCIYKGEGVPSKLKFRDFLIP